MDIVANGFLVHDGSLPRQHCMERGLRLLPRRQFPQRINGRGQMLEQRLNFWDLRVILLHAQNYVAHALSSVLYTGRLPCRRGRGSLAVRCGSLCGKFGLPPRQLRNGGLVPGDVVRGSVCLIFQRCQHNCLLIDYGLLSVDGRRLAAMQFGATFKYSFIFL